MSSQDCRNLLKEFELQDDRFHCFCLSESKISCYYLGNFKSVFKKNEIIPELYVLIVIRSIDTNNKTMKIIVNMFTI